MYLISTGLGVYPKQNNSSKHQTYKRNELELELLSGPLECRYLPPKKPEEIKPEDAPPPIWSLRYVTVQPSFSNEDLRVRVIALREVLTANGYFHSNVY